MSNNQLKDLLNTLDDLENDLNENLINSEGVQIKSKNERANLRNTAGMGRPPPGVGMGMKLPGMGANFNPAEILKNLKPTNPKNESKPQAPVKQTPNADQKIVSKIELEAERSVSQSQKDTSIIKNANFIMADIEKPVNKLLYNDKEETVKVNERLNNQQQNLDVEDSKKPPLIPRKSKIANPLIKEQNVAVSSDKEKDYNDVIQTPMLKSTDSPQKSTALPKRNNFGSRKHYGGENISEQNISTNIESFSSEEKDKTSTAGNVNKPVIIDQPNEKVSVSRGRINNLNVCARHDPLNVQHLESSYSNNQSNNEKNKEETAEVKTVSDVKSPILRNVDKSSGETSRPLSLVEMRLKAFEQTAKQNEPFKPTVPTRRNPPRPSKLEEIENSSSPIKKSRPLSIVEMRMQQFNPGAANEAQSPSLSKVTSHENEEKESTKQDKLFKDSSSPTNETTQPSPPKVTAYKDEEKEFEDEIKKEFQIHDNPTEAAPTLPSQNNEYIPQLPPRRRVVKVPQKYLNAFQLNRDQY